MGGRNSGWCRCWIDVEAAIPPATSSASVGGSDGTGGRRKRAAPAGSSIMVMRQEINARRVMGKGLAAPGLFQPTEQPHPGGCP